MVGKVFKNWKKVALEKNCKNQYFLIKLLLKVKNHIENIVQENMVVSCGYIARCKNSLVFMRKWLILKVVKFYMINTWFKRSLEKDKKLLLEKL